MWLKISKNAFPVSDPMMVSMIHTPASRTPKRLAVVQNVMTTLGLTQPVVSLKAPYSSFQSYYNIY
jgi:hypothetical protein